MNNPSEQIDGAPPHAPTAAQPAWRDKVLCGYCQYEIAGLEEGGRCPECGIVNIRGERAASHCTQAKYVMLALTLGWLGVHNFVARRLVVACVQLCVFLSAVALLLAGLHELLSRLLLEKLGAALALLLGLCVWVLLDALCVTRDGNRRLMPGARRRKKHPAHAP